MDTDHSDRFSFPYEKNLSVFISGRMFLLSPNGLGIIRVALFRADGCMPLLSGDGFNRTRKLAHCQLLEFDLLARVVDAFSKYFP